jgi:hypothetical protein
MANDNQASNEQNSKQDDAKKVVLENIKEQIKSFANQTTGQNPETIKCLINLLISQAHNIAGGNPYLSNLVSSIDATGTNAISKAEAQMVSPHSAGSHRHQKGHEAEVQEENKVVELPTIKELIENKTKIDCLAEESAKRTGKNGTVDKDGYIIHKDSPWEGEQTANIEEQKRLKKVATSKDKLTEHLISKDVTDEVIVEAIAKVEEKQETRKEIQKARVISYALDRPELFDEPVQTDKEKEEFEKRAIEPVEDNTKEINARRLKDLSEKHQVSKKGNMNAASNIQSYVFSKDSQGEFIHQDINKAIDEVVSARIKGLENEKLTGNKKLSPEEIKEHITQTAAAVMLEAKDYGMDIKEQERMKKGFEEVLGKHGIGKEDIRLAMVKLETKGIQDTLINANSGAPNIPSGGSPTGPSVNISNQPNVGGRGR